MWVFPLERLYGSRGRRLGPFAMCERVRWAHLSLPSVAIASFVLWERFIVDAPVVPERGGCACWAVADALPASPMPAEPFGTLYRERGMGSDRAARSLPVCLWTATSGCALRVWQSLRIFHVASLRIYLSSGLLISQSALLSISLGLPVCQLLCLNSGDCTRSFAFGRLYSSRVLPFGDCVVPMCGCLRPSAIS